MKKLFFRLLGTGLACTGLAGFLGGCKSAPLSHYVSPRVEGRVVDAASNQPLKGVEVRRGGAEDRSRTTQPGKGAEIMTRAPSVHTESDGTFAMQSQRDAVLLRKPNWYSITLTFRQKGYESFTASYIEATNSLTGEPVVQTGDIRLAPLVK